MTVSRKFRQKTLFFWHQVSYVRYRCDGSMQIPSFFQPLRQCMSASQIDRDWDLPSSTYKADKITVRLSIHSFPKRFFLDICRIPYQTAVEENREWNLAWVSRHRKAFLYTFLSPPSFQGINHMHESNNGSLCRRRPCSPLPPNRKRRRRYHNFFASAHVGNRSGVFCAFSQSGFACLRPQSNWPIKT